MQSQIEEYLFVKENQAVKSKLFVLAAQQFKIILYFSISRALVVVACCPFKTSREKDNRNIQTSATALLFKQFESFSFLIDIPLYS